MIRVFKSSLFVVLVVPVGLGAMEPLEQPRDRTEPNKIELGKQLVTAAHYRNWPKVEQLIVQGADLNQKDHDGWTTLIFAARDDRKAVAQMLIEAGADLNMQSTAGVTALILAVMKGDQGIAQKLIVAGANLNLQTHNGRTALMWIPQGNLPMAHMLMEAMLKRTRERKERVSTFLLCLVRLHNRQFSNLKHLFKRFRREMFGEYVDAFQEVARIEEIPIRNQLLEKYGLRPISNSEAQ